MCAWVLKSVKSVFEIDKIYVSTEDEEIVENISSIDPTITIINCPLELAADSASTESVMLHFAENVDFDVIVTLQVTSPLTRLINIKNGLTKFFSDNFNSLVTGVRVKRFFWDFNNKPLNYDLRNRSRRQDFGEWIMENGAFNITDYKTLIEPQCRLGGKIGILEMPEETGYEIDEPKDWEVVERLLLAKKRSQLNKTLENVIRLLMT